MKRMRIAITLLLLTLLAPAAALTAQGGPARPEPPAANPGGLLFIENAGQFDPAARFQVWGGPSTAWLAEDAIWLSQVEGSKVQGWKVEGSIVDSSNLQPSTFQPDNRPGNLQRVNLRLSFPGANPHPVPEPFDRLDTHVSYFIGDDPAKWRADVPVWGGVRYRDLYPGLDLEMTGQNGQWSWRLVRNQQSAISSPQSAVRSQQSVISNPAVTLRIEGADAVTANEGALRLSTAAGDLILPLLQAAGSSDLATVQPQGPQVFEVAAPFASVRPNPQRPELRGARSAMPETAGYAVRNPQSVTDNPADLRYATFLGGSGWDYGGDIAVESAGQAYVSGTTYSADFPASLGPGYDTSFNGGDCDAFVVKLDAAGTGLRYATFLGGGGDDYGDGIGVDDAGRAYVTGGTWSVDFPTSLGPAYDTSYNGGGDAFVVKLDAAGTALLYATFLGGSDWDRGTSIAVDGVVQAYVTGFTYSADFPASRGPGYDTSYNGGWDAFVVKLDAAGTALLYATFLGGSDWDRGTSIAVDGVGQAYVTGCTYSADFPASLGPGYDTSFNGGRDAFVVKLGAAGTALVYATFLGGSDPDDGYGIAADDAGEAYVTGYTDSADFPASRGTGYDTSFNGDLDAFVIKLDAAGTTLLYATFLGGSRYDWGKGIAADDAGEAYVTGYTDSADFPASRGRGYDTSYNGGRDAFVVALSAAGTALVYATFLGGSDPDDGYGIAVDGAGQAYVTGCTYSADFPASLGPGYDTSFNGGEDDAFVVKLDTAPWASWAQGDRPLLVPPAGAAAVVDYGNQTPPVPLAAQVTGAALFDAGAGGGTTSINTTLPDASGAYALRLIPAIGATAGQTLTVRVEIGPVMLTKDGWIARQVWLPLILRR